MTILDLVSFVSDLIGIYSDVNSISTDRTSDVILVFGLINGDLNAIDKDHKKK